MKVNDLKLELKHIFYAVCYLLSQTSQIKKQLREAVFVNFKK